MIKNSLVPIVIEQTEKGERSFDIYSRLLRERIIFLTGEINDTSADLIIAQLLYLEAEDPVSDIHFYINSPGGLVTSGLAIYDTIQYIQPKIATFCLGQAASMAAVLLSAGEKDKRYILPNARVMIHQALGSFSGQASDINIHAQQILKVKQTLNNILMQHTKNTLKKIEKDTDRDYFLSAKEAIEYGIVDKIMLKKA